MSHAYVCRSCGAINRVPADKSGGRCGRCHTELSPGPVDVDDDALEKLVANSPVPVLVDFWAAWCGPCRMVAPHIEALAERLQGRLIVAKVDVDQHKRTAGALGVQGIPTLAVYQGGRSVRVEAGARTGAQLEAFVAPYL
jgi:thioredoxin 2